MYKLYFGKVDNTEYIPALPEEIKISIGGSNQSVSLINFGEYNIIKSPKLKEIALNISLWKEDFYFLGGKSPVYYRNLFEGLQKEKSVCQMEIVREQGNVFSVNESLKCSIESYVFKEWKSNYWEFSFVLKEYKEPWNFKWDIKYTGNIDEDGNLLFVENNGQEDNREIPKEYVVVSGDTLWDIGKFFYGDGSKYKEIAKINNIKNPNKISVGKVINLRID